MAAHPRRRRDEPLSEVETSEHKAEGPTGTVPSIPPIALPGGSVPSGRPRDRATPSPPRPPLRDASPSTESARPPEPRGRRGSPGSTYKSLPPADVQTEGRRTAAPSIAPPPEPEPPSQPAPRPGKPRVELRVPTGWNRSVTDADLMHRKVKPAPLDMQKTAAREERTKAAGPKPKRALSSPQFLLIVVVVAVLNAPLLIVSGGWLRARLADDGAGGPLSLEEVATLELAMEARPQDADGLLGDAGLNRQSWSDLRGAITADPARRAEFARLRARIESR